MEDKVLELLNQLIEGQKRLEDGQNQTNVRLDRLEEGQNETNTRLDRIENKITSVYEQTADLTEFKTETKQSLAELKEDVKSIRDDLNNVELITAKNYSDIVKLKAIK